MHLLLQCIIFAILTSPLARAEDLYGPTPPPPEKVLAIPIMSVQQQSALYRAVSDELLALFGRGRLPMRPTDGEPQVVMELVVDDLTGILGGEILSTPFQVRTKLDSYSLMCVGTASYEDSDFHVQGLTCTDQAGSDRRVTTAWAAPMAFSYHQRGFENYGGVQDSICAGAGAGVLMIDPDALRRVRGGRLPVRGFFQTRLTASGCGGYSFFGKSEDETVRAGQLDLQLPFGIITESSKTRTQFTSGVNTELTGQYSEGHLLGGSGINFRTGIYFGLFRDFGKPLALEEEEQAAKDPQRSRHRRNFFALTAELRYRALIHKFPDAQALDHESTLMMGHQLMPGIRTELFAQRQRIRSTTEASVNAGIVGMENDGVIIDLRASQTADVTIRRHRKNSFFCQVAYTLRTIYAPDTHYPTHGHTVMLGCGYGRRLK